MQLHDYEGTCEEGYAHMKGLVENLPSARLSLVSIIMRKNAIQVGNRRVEAFKYVF